MQLRDYTQINSNFFYSKHITPYNKLGKYEFKVNPKKLTQIQFNRLMEHVVFKKGFATLIQTKQGDFVFYGVTQDFTPKQVQNSIANLAKTEPTYFFRNVDYFNYGEFGYAENGKIVRYLKYNSEATDDENVVEWVGKPHDWEYNSHTFYTKQKLEDCEMFFDSEAVCNMIDYYLPFIKDGVDIENIIIYSNQEKVKQIITAAIKNKPYVELLKFTSYSHAEIVKTLIKHNIESMGTTVLILKDKIVMNNYLLNSTNFKKEDENKQFIISDKSTVTIPLKSLNFKNFNNCLLKLIHCYKNAEKVNYKVVQKRLQVPDQNENYFQAYIVSDFFEQDKKIIVGFGVAKYYNKQIKAYTEQFNYTKLAGVNFETKTFKKIFKEIKKLQKAL